MKPHGNAPETVFLRWNRTGTRQKPCFCDETAREQPRNRVSTMKPFGNAPETVFLRWNRSGIAQKHWFYAETAREQPRNIDSALKPRGNTEKDEAFLHSTQTAEPLIRTFVISLPSTELLSLKY